MAVKLSDFVNERAEIFLPTPLGEIRVVYRPNKRTLADEARMAAAQGEEAFRELIIAIENLVVEWDLVGPMYDPESGVQIVGEDQPIPVKRDVLQYMSTKLLSAILQAIMEDMRPNAQATTTSQRDSQKLFATGSMS